MRIQLSTQPIVDPNNVLPSSGKGIDSALRAGTLAILDPAHSALPMSAVPGNGETLPNIVPTDQLNALLGASLADADYRFTATILGLGAGIAVSELTPKKALSTTITQTAQTAQVRVSYDAAGAIKQYILNHLDHEFLFIMEDVVTRVAGNVSGGAGNAQPPGFVAQNVSASFNNFLAAETAGGFFPSSGAALTGQQVTGGGHNTIGERLLAIAAKGFTGSVPATPGAFTVGPVFGGAPGYTSNTYYNKYRSGALRRFVIEDLTVSGISFDRAVNGNGLKDSHLEQWQRDLAATYGRWAGDTLRDPVTIP